MLLPDSVRATLLEVGRADVHGQPNWRLLLALEDDPAVQEARLAVESVYPDPRPGDAVIVHRVLGEPVEVRRA